MHLPVFLSVFCHVRSRFTCIVFVIRVMFVYKNNFHKHCSLVSLYKTVLYDALFAV